MSLDAVRGGLESWTELCEICNWDEIEALRVLERHIQAKAPQPSGRTRDLCIALTNAYVQLKSDIDRQSTMS